MSSTAIRRDMPKWARLGTALLLLGYLAMVLRNAWLSDDAYITFRTIDNFVSGYGLTWNVAERVQTYTHPLWMLLLSGIYFLTREIYFSSLALSIILSVASVILVTVGLARSPQLGWIGILIFGLSKASVDYATSGLENPLTHLILALFLLIYLRHEMTPRKLGTLSLLACLGVVNRLDTVLIYAPLLTWGWLQRRDLRSIATIALGFVPLLLWQVFSLIYYGFPFPNTAYAKLNAGLIQRADWFRAGGNYLLNSLIADPLTLISIGFAMSLPLWTRDWRKLPLSLSSGFYLAYVFYIGGDFMSGRFLTAPLVLAVASLMDSHVNSPLRLGLILGGVLVLGAAAPYSPIHASGAIGGREDDPAWISGNLIVDERASYYPYAGLWPVLRRNENQPNHPWAIAGADAREQRIPIVETRSVGFWGYFTGPEVYIVDQLGLGSALLARLPPDKGNWYVGHLERPTPKGYIESLKTGENRIADSNLAAYYAKLDTIIRGDLLDVERLRVIWRFNLGAYDHYRDAYAYFEGPTFIRHYQIVNPTDATYVYAYVWNNGAAETYVLDDTSGRGSIHTAVWHISAQGVEFTGEALQKTSSIGALSDAEPLNIGVYFSETPESTKYEIYEQRFWFQIGKNQDLAFILPGQGYHSADGAQGYWAAQDISTVMQQP